jgi:pyruvate kinase
VLPVTICTLLGLGVWVATCCMKHTCPGWRDVVQVYSEVEAWVQREKFGYMKYPALCAHGKDRISEEICTSAANISSRLQTAAIFVYTRTGQTAGFVSRRRPACPIFAVTGVQRMAIASISFDACHLLHLLPAHHLLERLCMHQACSRGMGGHSVLGADSMSVYRRLACRWGVTALLMPLSDQPENNVQTTFECVPVHC